jgi:DNA polymerase I
MEFRTLTRRVADKLGSAAACRPAAAAPPPEDRRPHPAAPLPFDHAAYECVRDMAALDRWIARIRERGHVAVDTETTSLDEMQADLVGISLCVDAGHGLLHPGRATGRAGATCSARPWPRGSCRWTEVLAALKPVLEDPRSSRSART